MGAQYAPPVEISTPTARIVDLMEATGWTYSELMATPYGVVEEMELRIAARRRWTSEKRKLGNG